MVNWRSFPDPRQGGILVAPFGPGCYELRMQTEFKWSDEAPCRPSLARESLPLNVKMGEVEEAAEGIMIQG